MKKLTLTLVAIALPISAATISQFPEPVAAVVPILNAPAASGELAFTNFPDECALKFHGRDLIFTLPCAQIWDVRHAGFREKWLSIGITSGSFATQYGFLLQTAPEPGAPHRLDIALPRDASLESAEDFAQALEAASTNLTHRPSSTRNPASFFEPQRCISPRSPAASSLPKVSTVVSSAATRALPLNLHPSTTSAPNGRQLSRTALSPYLPPLCRTPISASSDHAA